VLPIELSSRHQRIYQTRLQRERQKILRLIDDLDANRFTILTSLTTLRQDAELAAKYEAKVVSDLEAGGMKVHRMAGVFKDPGTMRPEMNFMNTEKGTGADGKRFIVALGGEDRSEATMEG